MFVQTPRLFRFLLIYILSTGALARRRMVRTFLRHSTRHPWMLDRHYVTPRGLAGVGGRGGGVYD